MTASEAQILIDRYIDYTPVGPRIIASSAVICECDAVILAADGYASTYWLHEWLPAALKWFYCNITLAEYLLKSPSVRHVVTG